MNTLELSLLIFVCKYVLVGHYLKLLAITTCSPKSDLVISFSFKE